MREIQKSPWYNLQGHLPARFMERLDQIRSGTQRPSVNPDLPRPQLHLAPTSGGLYAGVDTDGERGPWGRYGHNPQNPHWARAHFTGLIQGTTGGEISRGSGTPRWPPFSPAPGCAPSLPPPIGMAAFHLCRAHWSYATNSQLTLL